MKALLVATAATALLAACSPTGTTAQSTGGACTGEANYNVTFQANWTASSANAAIPSNAHFSPAYGATHSSDAALYSRGRASSAGIKSMAETGATSALEGETAALRQAGLLRDTDKGGRLDAVGTTTLNLTANASNDQLTLVSMIAPSPDWFVGVSGLDLCQNGSWITSINQDLATYDAGTDSGTGFASADAPTNPRAPITFLNKDLEDQTRPSNAVFGRIIVQKI